MATHKRNGRAARTARKNRAGERAIASALNEVETSGEMKSQGQILTERISILDSRLGIGVGAKRERASIARRMQEA